MIIMSALRFIMVVLIALPLGYVLKKIFSELCDNVINEEKKQAEKRKREMEDEKRRSIYNDRRSRWGR